jgi:hypothetical protein
VGNRTVNRIIGEDKVTEREVKELKEIMMKDVHLTVKGNR